MTAVLPTRTEAVGAGRSRRVKESMLAALLAAM